MRCPTGRRTRLRSLPPARWRQSGNAGRLRPCALAGLPVPRTAPGIRVRPQGTRPTWPVRSVAGRRRSTLDLWRSQALLSSCSPLVDKPFLARTIGTSEPAILSYPSCRGRQDAFRKKQVMLRSGATKHLYSADGPALFLRSYPSHIKRRDAFCGKQGSVAGSIPARCQTLRDAPVALDRRRAQVPGT